MEKIREVGQNIGDTMSNAKMPSPDDIRQSAMNTVNSTMNTVDNVRNNVSNNLNQFSSQVSVNADQSFLNSNSIVAKFAFVIFSVIIFIILLYLGTRIIFYMFSKYGNTYVVKGILAGNSNITVSSDSKNSVSATLLRSNDQPGGLEYTWSVWLNINSIKTDTDTAKYEHVFNKGSSTFDNTTNMTTTNTPGVYISKNADKTIKLNIKLSIYESTEESIGIDNIPLKKWFHLAIRMQNTVADVYINGSIAQRKILNGIPDQNTYDVLIGHSGGFIGNLSDLRYYNYALSIFEINNLLLFGPNMTPSSMSPDANNTNIHYLSSSWYFNKM
jgi:hypothetical protein